MSRQLHLGAFLMATGHHIAAWRHPSVPRGAGVDLAHYRALARLAEAACFDLLFIADSVAAAEGPQAPRMARSDLFEPLTLLAALAGATERIGLVATVTTSYHEPYSVARAFASLDHLSAGRAGWNLVTSDAAAEAGNFGREQHLGHAERYARANEFQQVVAGLWDSWADDAFVRDQASGQYYRADGVRALDHRGAHFAVRGPLNVPRSPQGRPVLVQAGASPAGLELAARSAEVVFTAQPDVASAQAFYADLKRRVVTAGRQPDALKIMPGVYVTVAATAAEARAKEAELRELVDPQVGIALLGRMLGNFDLSSYPPDGPLPELPLTDSGQQSRQRLLTELARRENLSLAQLGQRIAGGRGHLSLVGSAAEVADVLQHWFEQGAADGFNLMAPLLPGGLEDIVQHLIPELQRRGLFRDAYAGHTLREHLGLARPANPYFT
ncbi:MAG: LLM class flavin-dependent oxidoreductase [Pseudomonas oryzihabitans]